jgi:hypothetical protein
MQEEHKRKMIQMMKEKGITGIGQEGQITVNRNGKDVPMSPQEIVKVLQQQQARIIELETVVQQAFKEKKELENKIKQLQENGNKEKTETTKQSKTVTSTTTTTKDETVIHI